MSKQLDLSRRRRAVLATAALLVVILVIMAAGSPTRLIPVLKNAVVVDSIEYRAHRLGLSEIRGELTNNDLVTRSVDLKVLFYGSDGAVLGAVNGTVADIKTKTVKPFSLYTTTDVRGFTRYEVVISRTY